MKILFSFFILFFASNSFAEEMVNYRKFFDDSVMVGIPNDFTQASEATIDERFPDPINRPKIVFTSPDGLAIISLNMAENQGNRQSIIHFFRDIKNGIRENYPDNRFLKTDVIRGRSLALIEYTATSPSDQKLYNMMAFRYIGKNFFFFNFSCPVDEMDKYQATARDIAQDIEYVNEKSF